MGGICFSLTSDEPSIVTYNNNTHSQPFTQPTINSITLKTTQNQTVSQNVSHSNEQKYKEHKPTQNKEYHENKQSTEHETLIKQLPIQQNPQKPPKIMDDILTGINISKKHTSLLPTTANTGGGDSVHSDSYSSPISVTCTLSSSKTPLTINISSSLSMPIVHESEKPSTIPTNIATIAHDDCLSVVNEEQSTPITTDIDIPTNVFNKLTNIKSESECSLVSEMIPDVPFIGPQIIASQSDICLSPSNSDTPPPTLFLRDDKSFRPPKNYLMLSSVDSMSLADINYNRTDSVPNSRLSSMNNTPTDMSHLSRKLNRLPSFRVSNFTASHFGQLTPTTAMSVFLSHSLSPSATSRLKFNHTSSNISLLRAGGSVGANTYEPKFLNNCSDQKISDEDDTKSSTSLTTSNSTSTSTTSSITSPLKMPQLRVLFVSLVQLIRSYDNGIPQFILNNAIFVFGFKRVCLLPETDADREEAKRNKLISSSYLSPELINTLQTKDKEGHIFWIEPCASEIATILQWESLSLQLQQIPDISGIKKDMSIPSFSERSSNKSFSSDHVNVGARISLLQPLVIDDDEVNTGDIIADDVQEEVVEVVPDVQKKMSVDSIAIACETSIISHNQSELKLRLQLGNTTDCSIPIPNETSFFSNGMKSAKLQTIDSKSIMGSNTLHNLMYNQNNTVNDSNHLSLTSSNITRNTENSQFSNFSNFSMKKNRVGTSSFTENKISNLLMSGDLHPDAGPDGVVFLENSERYDDLSHNFSDRSDNLYIMRVSTDRHSVDFSAMEAIEEEYEKFPITAENTVREQSPSPSKFSKDEQRDSPKDQSQSPPKLIKDEQTPKEQSQSPPKLKKDEQTPKEQSQSPPKLKKDEQRDSFKPKKSDIPRKKHISRRTPSPAIQQKYQPLQLDKNWWIKVYEPCRRRQHDQEIHHLADYADIKPHTKSYSRSLSILSMPTESQYNVLGEEILNQFLDTENVNYKAIMEIFFQSNPNSFIPMTYFSMTEYVQAHIDQTFTAIPKLCLTKHKEMISDMDYFLTLSLSNIGGSFIAIGTGNGSAGGSVGTLTATVGGETPIANDLSIDECEQYVNNTLPIVDSGQLGRIVSADLPAFPPVSNLVQITNLRQQSSQESSPAYKNMDSNFVICNNYSFHAFSQSFDTIDEDVELSNVENGVVFVGYYNADEKSMENDEYWSQMHAINRSCADNSITHTRTHTHTISDDDRPFLGLNLSSQPPLYIQHSRNVNSEMESVFNQCSVSSLKLASNEETTCSDTLSSALPVFNGANNSSVPVYIDHSSGR